MPIMRIATLLSVLCVPVLANANCARDVQDFTPKVKQIKDERTRQRAEDYLQRAQRELDENDEFECQSAISALNKLMAPQAIQTGKQ